MKFGLAELTRRQSNMKLTYVKDALAVEGSCSFHCHKNSPLCSPSKFLTYLASIIFITGILCYIYVYGFSLRSRKPATVICCPTRFRNPNIPQVLLSNASDVVKRPQHSGRFLYMVTGESKPNPRWKRLSEQDGVYVLFTAWKYPLPTPSISEKIQTYYYPNSTWTSCRNFMLKKALALEEKHGEKFDFFLFADEDVLLCSRSAKTPNDWSKDPLSSALLLHTNLLRDQPARASAEYSARNINEFGLWCVRSCAFDGALDIYHRTIVPYLLPYYETFDEFSWQMSQYMSNLRSQALLEDYCYIYRDVFINPMGNVHGSYPTDYDLLTNATILVSNCLAKRGLTLSTRPEESEAQIRTRAIYRPTPEIHTAACTPQQPDVNYSDVLESILRAWPLNCSNS